MEYDKGGQAQRSMVDRISGSVDLMKLFANIDTAVRKLLS